MRKVRHAALVLLALLAGGPAWAGEAAPAGPVAIEVGPVPELVFSWRSQRCDKDDIPDTPLRAVRTADGEVIAFASHYDVRRFTGQDLSSLRRDCSVVRQSRRLADPSAFDDKTWLSAIWSPDGVTMHGLGHNEFQGNTHPGACRYTDYRACWYNAVVPLVSTDGGRTFARPAGSRPVAAINQRADEGEGRPRGFFEPSNIVEKDGFLFAFVHTTGNPGQKPGACLLRTTPAGIARGDWEMLTAAGWQPSAHDPYANERDGPICQPVRNLWPVSSVAAWRGRGVFIAVMPILSEENRGKLAYSLSADLVSWSKPKLLFDVVTGLSKDRCAAEVFSYPSLIDPRAATRNFQDVGDEAFLYMTRQLRRDCKGSMNRDLVRFPVRLSGGPVRPVADAAP